MMPEPLEIEISFTSRNWLEQLPEAEDICHRAAKAAFAVAGPQNGGQVEVSIVLADDEHGRQLNRDYRGKDKTTNVLSFGNMDLNDAGPGPVLLGDIVISCGVTSAEAVAEGKAVASHLSHLVVHGMLHLLGHDHVQDEAAMTMEKLERRILEQLGIDDPYDGELKPQSKAVAS